jgi:uncharacterized membrane protein
MSKTPVKRPRLMFIDMARSIAIILMLEGHFVDQTLGSRFRSPDAHFVNPDFFWYDCWHIIRGYTSPMFLTMTGLIFVYLLYANKGEPFFGNERVKKGFKRVAELLFWGYVLMPKGFHILQCIGFGIMGLLLTYGLYRLIKVIPLWVYYMVFSLIIFSFWAPLNTIRNEAGVVPWPYGWPDFLQNMIHAPAHRSMFPLAPHLGYTFFGAGLGVILHSAWINKSKWLIPGFLFFTGILLFFYSTEFLYFIHHLMTRTFGFGIQYLASGNWLFENLGMILMVLGLLSLVEKLFTIKENLFIRMGRNTLPVFVVHMIILYGAIIHFGIAKFISRDMNPLNPYQAAIGATLFIATFALMVYYIKPLTAFYDRVLGIVFPIRKRLSKENKK